MTARIFIAVSMLLVFISACSPHPSKPVVTERDGVSAVSNTADLQSTFIKAHGHLDRYCAARAADVADTSSTGGSIGASALGEGEGVSEGTSQGAVSLGGRNPAVLLVREMLYRACELSMNLNTNVDQTIDIYDTFLEAAESMAKDQQGTGVAAMGQKGAAMVQIKDSSSSNVSDSMSEQKSTSDTKTTEDTDDKTENVTDGSDNGDNSTSNGN